MYDRDMTGMITNIQHYSIHDGPGIRTTVFLKKCPLRCYWCQNPETQSDKKELFINSVLCVNCGRCIPTCKRQAISRDVETQLVVTDRALCSGCGRCIAACLPGARKRSGETVTVGSVIDEVVGDRAFYKRSGGGMTISGGEVTAQSAFALELLRGAHEMQLHTAMETCGFTTWEKLLPLLEETDYLVYDLKAIDPEKHKRGTGVDNRLILENARLIAAHREQVLFRMPLIPKFNDTPEDVRQLRDFVVKELKLTPDNIELLKYNTLGEAKYDKLGRDSENLHEQPQETSYYDQLCDVLRETSL